MGRWGEGRGGCSKHYETSGSHANETEGAKRQSNMQEKMDTKEGKEGIWPPKAVFLLWKSQQKWVSIKGSVLTMLVHNKLG